MRSLAPARRAVLVLVGLLASLALTLTLPGVAAADVEKTRDAVRGQLSWTPTAQKQLVDSRGFGFEVDQRTLGLGERAKLAWTVSVPKGNTYCGELVFQITRYQAYSLYWKSPNGQTTQFLYRGGLVADSGRPYVGVFFTTGNKLVIQTYNRTSAGAVTNAWVAASATAPQSRLVLQGNGLWASGSSSSGGSPWLTGPAGVNC